MVLYNNFAIFYSVRFDRKTIKYHYKISTHIYSISLQNRATLQRTLHTHCTPTDYAASSYAHTYTSYNTSFAVFQIFDYSTYLLYYIRRHKLGWSFLSDRKASVFDVRILCFKVLKIP